GTLNVPPDYPLAARLSEAFGLPAMIANDAQAAAWGEYRFGAGRGADMAFLTISTGIGGGLVLDGRPRLGIAGHFGILRGPTNGAAPLEDEVSGRWIAAEAKRAGHTQDAAGVFAAAGRGEAWADAIITASARKVALLCQDIKLALDPARIVMGGGIGLAPGSNAFDANLLATYSIGKYAPFMDPVTLDPNADKVFGAAVLKTMQYQGKQYGVPTDLSLQFMYYRKDLVDGLLQNKDGWKTYSDIAQKYLGKPLQPKDPADWTWDDWAATALYFTKAVNPQSPVRYGAILQMKNLLFNMMVFEDVPRAYGGNWTDDKGNVTVD